MTSAFYIKWIFLTYIWVDLLISCPGPAEEVPVPAQGQQQEEETRGSQVGQETREASQKRDEDGAQGQQCGGALLPPPAG